MSKRIDGIEGDYDRALVRKVRAALKAGERVGVFEGAAETQDVYILGKVDRLLGCCKPRLARSLRQLILG